MKLKLLSKTPDAKTIKGVKKGYTTFILYLDPRMKNICKWASPGCKASCLFTAGRGAMNTVQAARRRKTDWYLQNQIGFCAQLHNELNYIRTWAKKVGRKVCIRLNGTSDLDFLGLIETHDDIQFYDYTKDITKYLKAFKMPEFKNYHLTFSRSETNEEVCKAVLFFGGSVAVVFGKELPKTWMGYKVISGDKTDLRFKDPKNVVVGLKAKGKARKDHSGFVIPMVNV